MRYDYRNDYKDMTIEQLKAVLVKLENRLIDSIGIDNKSASDYAKRIAYINQKINKG